MPESNDSSVISGLRQSRARRQPPTRRVVPGAVAAPQLSEPAPAPAQPEQPASAAPTAPAAPPPTPPPPAAPPENARARRRTEPLAIALDDPTTNYAVRVRRTLDDLLSQRLGELRARGTRSSKVEITELLLWELAGATPAQLDARLAEFRRHAPR